MNRLPQAITNSLLGVGESIPTIERAQLLVAQRDRDWYRRSAPDEKGAMLGLRERHPRLAFGFRVLLGSR